LHQRASDDFAEVDLFRNIEAPLWYHLGGNKRYLFLECLRIINPYILFLSDLPRLSNFDITHVNNNDDAGKVHIYKVGSTNLSNSSPLDSIFDHLTYQAVPKVDPKAPPRYFARLVVFQSDNTSSLAAETETIIVETLDALALFIGQVNRYF